MGRELAVDVAVIGGGLGGVAAALAAARAGRRVLLTEESDWLGGQLTSQAVPPDEHPWIEQFGCPASYRTLREGTGSTTPLVPAVGGGPRRPLPEPRRGR